MTRKRRLFTVALLCLIAAACKSPERAAAPVAAITDARPPPANSPSAAPSSGSEAEDAPAKPRSAPLSIPATDAVGSSEFGVRVLYTWTTDDQIAALRRTPMLLTRTESPTLGTSGYSKWIQKLAAQKSPLGQLLSEPRFARGRHAWVNTFGAALGTGAEQYGQNLIQVTLRPDAQIAYIDTSGSSVTFMSAAGVAQPSLMPDKLAAVYFVSSSHFPSGTLHAPESLYREYILVNETMIESFAFNTPELAATTSRQQAWLEALAKPAHEFQVALRSDPDFVDGPDWHYFVGEFTRAWQLRHAREAVDGLLSFGTTLCFASDEYYPTPPKLTALAAALAATKSGVPFTHTVNPAALPAPPPLASAPRNKPPAPAPQRRRNGTF
jgi:hypothetical protein